MNDKDYSNQYDFDHWLENNAGLANLDQETKVLMRTAFYAGRQSARDEFAEDYDLPGEDN